MLGTGWAASRVYQTVQRRAQQAGQRQAADRQESLQAGRCEALPSAVPPVPRCPATTRAFAERPTRARAGPALKPSSAAGGKSPAGPSKPTIDLLGPTAAAPPMLKQQSKQSSASSFLSFVQKLVQGVQFLLHLQQIILLHHIRLLVYPKFFRQFRHCRF